MKFEISGDGWVESFDARKGPLGLEWDISSETGQGSLRLEPIEDSIFRMHIGDRSHTVTVLPGFRPGQPMRILVDDIYHELMVKDDGDLLQEFLGGPGGGGGHEEVLSVMPGIVRKLMVEVGQSVKEGEPMLILEAMKMENEILAPSDGVVDQLPIEEGSTLAANDLLLTLKSEEE